MNQKTIQPQVAGRGSLFKKIADDLGIPYQKLIDLYLLDCVKNKKKLSMKWTG